MANDTKFYTLLGVSKVSTHLSPFSLKAPSPSVSRPESFVREASELTPPVTLQDASDDEIKKAYKKQASLSFPLS